MIRLPRLRRARRARARRGRGRVRAPGLVHVRPRTGAALPLVLLAAYALPASAQPTADGSPHVRALERAHPGVYGLLVRVGQARGVAFGQLAADGGAVRSRGGGDPSPGFDSTLVERLAAVVSGDGWDDALAAEAEAGYAALGERAAEVIARGRAFQLEAVGILADAAVEDRRAALAEAVERYRSRPDVALPSDPKDMDVLYDHPQTFAFREGYPDLAGLVWAGLWLKLAVTEPLTDLHEPTERAAGLDTVVSRYHAKLSYGEPPRSFPSQIPLAPAIAPGLIYLSPEVAMIWDNLSLMQEVLADILASPDVTDVQAALDAAVGFFLAPDVRVTERGQWESMALQHGIFFQGGYPLAVMTRSELNGDGHAAHLRAGASPRPMQVIPN